MLLAHIRAFAKARSSAATTYLNAKRFVASSTPPIDFFADENQIMIMLYFCANNLRDLTILLKSWFQGNGRVPKEMHDA